MISRLFSFFSRNRVLIEATKFRGIPIIWACPNSSIRIKDSTINSGHLGNALSQGGKTTIRTISANSEIDINGVGMSDVVIVARKKIVISEGTLIGEGCLITDSDHHYLGSNLEISRNDPKYIKSESIYIGKNVFIGARSIILKGAYIKDNTIIGAGSVVR